LLLALLLSFCAALTLNSATAQAAFTFTSDEGGADDQPGQKDLTRHGVDGSNLPVSLDVTWNWDTTGFSGQNTGDACSLFDNDDNGFVDFAVCVTINQDPAVQAATSPRLFTCGDDKVDRCTQPLAQIPNPTSTCTVAITATQPFAAGESTPNDTTATCTIFLADVGGTNARLVNTCSYPSDNPNSDPSDCVLVIRDGFIRIVKNASPNDATAQFNFFLDSGATPVFTSNGSGTSSIIPVTTSVTHSLTETAPTGWTQTSATCSDGSPINAIAVAEDETVVCTFNNLRDTGKLEVRKSLSPTGDPGKFNLQIDGTTDPDAGDVGNGGSTGEQTLNSGDHTVGETAGTGTDLANYQKSIVCKDKDGTGTTVAEAATDDGGPLTVPVGHGADIVCVVTNTRETGTLEVRKSLNPSDDAGRFNLQIDGSTDPDAGDVGDGGSTGAETVNTGDHTVGETAGTDTDLADYQKSIVCKDQDGAGDTVANTTGDDGGPLTVPVGHEDDVVCTITNSRDTGKLEVRKDLEPNDDGGKFNLQIDGSTDPNAGNVGDGGSTGEETLNTGDHTVGETAGTDTDLDDYQKSIVCKDQDGTGDTVAETTTDDGGPLTVPVGSGDDIVCTITNTRETGKLEVRKDLRPDTDPGRFNLQIDGTTDPDAIDVGDGGSTGEQVLNTGNHTVRETAGTGTSLTNYAKTIVCKGSNGTGSIVAQSSGSPGPLTVNVTDGSDIVCTIKNIRKTGKLEVVKKVNPTNDAGRFDLRIDGNVEKDEAAHNDTTGEKTLNTGNHSVSETADGETDLGNYTSSIECKDGNGAGAIVASGSGSGPVTVNLAYGQDVVCTITNTRKAGKLEVVKKLDPTTDPGRFDLRIDGNVEKDEAGHNDTTGEKTLNTGNHTVSETADGETTLTNYTSAVECKGDNGSGSVVASGSGAGPLTVNVTDGSDIVCTITNTRKTGKLEIVKKLDPETDPGLFDLRIDGVIVADEVPHNGSTGEQAVVTGSHTVSETADFETTVADFTTAIVCRADNGTGAIVAQGTGTALTVSVTENADIVCVMTNTRKLNPGRMTGGGSILPGNPPRVTHGFTLHCNRNVRPNRLEVNWGSGQNWFLESGTLIYAICTNDPAIEPENPTAEFDTYTGAGYGRYNGVSGAKAEWVFTDAGEPGTTDTMKIKITDVNGNVVLNVGPLPLTKGNHQAHK
jgi:hypothetical protein